MHDRPATTIALADAAVGPRDCVDVGDIADANIDPPSGPLDYERITEMAMRERPAHTLIGVGHATNRERRSLNGASGWGIGEIKRGLRALD